MMKSAELIVKNSNVTAVKQYQVTDNIDPFDILRISCQFFGLLIVKAENRAQNYKENLAVPAAAAKNCKSKT
jgi:hypothetical protein